MRRNDLVSVRRPLAGNALESLKAHYVKQSFKPHAHDEYLIGVIESGVHSVWCRGEHHYATAGTIVTMHPGDVHHGEAGIPAGWAQRMIYVSERDLSALLEGNGEDMAGSVEFRQSFHQLSELADDFVRFHEVLHSSELRLARDVAFEALMRTVLGTLTPAPKSNSPRRIEEGRISDAVEYLRARVEDDVTLDELCTISGLKRRQTIGAFKRKTGLPPHAYHLVQKVKAVKAMLREGLSVADAAASAGFADQSHMTRHFVAMVGVTPNAYALSTR